MPDPKREIIKAAKKNSFESAKTLLAREPNLLDTRDKDGSTPLLCAVWKGHLQVVRSSTPALT